MPILGVAVEGDLPAASVRQAGAHDVATGGRHGMPVSTLIILAALGVLAWLLAGGWPYARDAYVADDGPVGLGAGVTAVCPACMRAGAHALPAGTVVAGAALPGRLAPVTPGGQGAAVGLKHATSGRDHMLRLECPSCGATYSVVAATRGVPRPRGPRD